MNATRILVATLIAWTGTNVARAQTLEIQNAVEAKLNDARAAASATDILAAPPGQYPPGTYASPYCGGQGCNGPVGGSGPITYEVYAVTGVTMPITGKDLGTSLKTGWTTGGGARTLWFRSDNSAAWVFDLGATYTGNNGRSGAGHVLNVATPRVSPISVNPITGQTTGGERIFPDGLADYTVRSMNRSNFNFGIGRDWWLDGPATLQSEQGPNFRIGSDIGGSWGSSSVQLVPVADPSNYLKRTGVTHSLNIGMHMGWEKPLGAWIITTDIKAQWSYTWTNIVPPLAGDIQDISILWTIGARF